MDTHIQTYAQYMIIWVSSPAHIRTNTLANHLVHICASTYVYICVHIQRERERERESTCFFHHTHTNTLHILSHTQYMPFTASGVQYGLVPGRVQVAQSELQQAQMRYAVAGDQGALRNMGASRQMSAKNKVRTCGSSLLIHPLSWLCTCQCSSLYTPLTLTMHT